MSVLSRGLDELDLRTWSPRSSTAGRRPVWPWPWCGTGRLAWFHGHGVAKASSRRPVTQDTVFRVGSVTKTFTAVAVMQLWERGLVDLDAPAND